MKKEKTNEKISSTTNQPRGENQQPNSVSLLPACGSMYKGQPLGATQIATLAHRLENYTPNPRLQSGFQNSKNPLPSCPENQSSQLHQDDLRTLTNSGIPVYGHHAYIQNTRNPKLGSSMSLKIGILTPILTAPLNPSVNRTPIICNLRTPSSWSWRSISIKLLSS